MPRKKRRPKDDGAPQNHDQEQERSLKQAPMESRCEEEERSGEEEERKLTGEEERKEKKKRRKRESQPFKLAMCQFPISPRGLH